LSSTQKVATVGAADCTNAAPVALAQEVGYATNFVLGGTTLDNDGAEVEVGRPGTTRLTWETDGLPVDLFDVRLVELTAVGLQTVLTEQRHYQTGEQILDIDERDLSSGKSYILVVASVFGFPGARDGNFENLVFPVATGAVLTSVFKIR
jgi:hypothetical protein